MLPGSGEGGMFQMKLELRSPAVITDSRGVRQTAFQPCPVTVDRQSQLGLMEPQNEQSWES